MIDTLRYTLEEKICFFIQGSVFQISDPKKLLSRNILFSCNFCKTTYRSSRPEVSVKKVFWKTLQNSQKKNICQIFFFNKVTCLRSATLSKKRLKEAQKFSCKFCGIFQNTFLQNTSSGSFSHRKHMKIFCQS